jgi:hypothetical protein
MTQAQVEQFVQSSISNIPLGRPGTTDEIAKAGKIEALCTVLDSAQR